MMLKCYGTFAKFISDFSFTLLNSMSELIKRKVFLKCDKFYKCSECDLYYIRKMVI